MDRKELYTKEANYHYRYKDLTSLLENERDIVKFVQDHRTVQRERLSVLDDYSKGRNTLMRLATKDADRSDSRMIHNFGKIITQFKVGYTTNNPIQLRHSNKALLDKLEKIDNKADMASHNAELMLDVSKYGRAYELLTGDEETPLLLLNVFETFVVYDYSVKKEPLLGVRYIDSSDNGTSYTRVTVYTESETIEYRMDGSTLEEIDRHPHLFGDVPVIEYQNNRFRYGDYEDSLSLINGYDWAQSDMADYLNDLVNSVLVIKGDIKDFKSKGSYQERKDYERMYKNKVIFAKSGIDADGKPTEVDAKYIYRNLDVAAVETYKGRIRKDIFTLSNVPDLTDESFSGNKSGEAMKYKLYGFQQSVSATMNNFKRAAKKRYRMLLRSCDSQETLMNRLVKKTQIALGVDFGEEISDLEIVFKPNIPTSIIDEMKMLTDSGTPLSTITKLGLVSFIDDPQAELERVNKEETTTSHEIEDYLANIEDHHHEHK